MPRRWANPGTQRRRRRPGPGCAADASSPRARSSDARVSPRTGCSRPLQGRARRTPPPAGPQSADRCRRGRSIARPIAERSCRRVCTTSARPKRRSAVVAPDVTPSPPVRHRRAAAHQRFEHRQAARRMHEDVTGRHPLRHAIRESLHAHAIRSGNAAATRRRAPRCDRTGRPRRRHRAVPAPRRLPRRRRRRPIRLPRRARRAPSAGSPSALRASLLVIGVRNSGRVKPWTQWMAVAAPAMRRTSGIDSGCVTRCTSTPGWPSSPAPRDR